MNKIFVCLFFALLINSTHVAANELSVGVTAEISSSPYRGVGHDASILPSVHYSGNTFFLDGQEAGVFLYQSEHHEVSILAEYYDNAFNPKKSKDNKIRNLDKRHATVMAGLDYLYKNSWGAINFNLSTDILRKNKGVVADLSYLAVLEKQNFTFAPKIGIKWQSNRFNNYYYGISEQEAVRTSFPVYQAGQGINPYIELGGSFKVTPKWDTFIAVHAQWLNNEINHSPMTHKNTQFSVKSGIKYHF